MPEHPRGVRRPLVLGSLVSAIALVGFALAMLAVRRDLSVATTALILIVPVVLGVGVGGFRVGVGAVVAGFLVYDYLFIPPYYTLSVGATQNWVALVVYVVVMLVVARVVATMQQAQAEAKGREKDSRRLVAISDLLIRDNSTQEVLDLLVMYVHEFFGLDAVVLLAKSGSWEIGARVGKPFEIPQFKIQREGENAAVSLRDAGNGTSGVTSRALMASGHPLGLLVVKGGALSGHQEELLAIFINQVAVALERSELREQAMRTQLLEEVDKWRTALMDSVSHDLRTPLSSIKAAVSDLRMPSLQLGVAERAELLEMVEFQTDYLARLVTNLLDASRIEAGALKLNHQAIELDEIIDEALGALGAAFDGDRLLRELPPELPLVWVDHVLVCQVLTNLFENAIRYAPEGSKIRVTAVPKDNHLIVTVADDGPGVDMRDRERIFQMFHRKGGGGRAGIGLSIAKAFVEAHGGTIKVLSVKSGAAFTFTLPQCPAMLPTA